MEDKVWFENTGFVPEGVAHDTDVEVMYRDGEVMVWKSVPACPNNLPEYWTLEGITLDVIKWRFV